VSDTIQPIFLLADSQLLFWRDPEGRLLLERARELLAEEAPGREPKAAYLGASNGDAPEFFELFAAAMAEVKIHQCRHVKAPPSAEDLAFLDDADLILLAGGDVARGWQAFQEGGIAERIPKRYYAGAVLVGLSAGAIQLGLQAAAEDGTPVDSFRLVPFVVDVHDEPTWAHLPQRVRRGGEHARGYGIPTGGGALYHSDYSLEPVRHPVTEIEIDAEGEARSSLVLPGQREDREEEAPRVVSEEEVVARALRALGEPEERAEESAGEPDQEPVH
jgi:peptidase E